VTVGDAVRVERSGPGGVVARVTLDRPEQRNALSAEIIDGLAGAFAGFATEPSTSLRAVVLAGEGRAFCAGADVNWMRAATRMSRAENEAQAATLGRLFLAIDACPPPVVARVQGPALGGGAGLLCIADVVVAEAGAVTGFPEVRLGLAAATIAPYVVRRIGEGRARALFTMGTRIDAAEAQRIGLVHRVVDGVGALDAAVDEAVAAILAGAPEAVRAAKALARELAMGHAGPVDLYPEEMARRLADRRAHPESAEGLAAFLERRKPSWAPGDDA
jgi:methylglutaconyl-CoA hydratase